MIVAILTTATVTFFLGCGCSLAVLSWLFLKDAINRDYAMLPLLAISAPISVISFCLAGVLVSEALGLSIS